MFSADFNAESTNGCDDTRKQMLKRALKDEGVQEVTASLAGIDAAITAASSELDDVFALKEEQKATLKAFLGEPRVFATLQCDATHYRAVTCV